MESRVGTMIRVRQQNVPVGHGDLLVAMAGRRIAFAPWDKGARGAVGEPAG